MNSVNLHSLKNERKTFVIPHKKLKQIRSKKQAIIEINSVLKAIADLSVR